MDPRRRKEKKKKDKSARHLAGERSLAKLLIYKSFVFCAVERVVRLPQLGSIRQEQGPLMQASDGDEETLLFREVQVNGGR